MTGAADHRGSLVAGLVLAATVLVATCSACTGSDPVEPSAGTPISASAAIRESDEQLIRAAISALNAASAGPVDQQQSALRAIVDPAGLGTLDECPPATTTVRFEPVWAGLRPDPSRGAAAGGSGYALPTLIRAYTGDRVTATDLTTLQVTVRSAVAYITPFCVG